MAASESRFLTLPLMLAALLVGGWTASLQAQQSNYSPAYTFLTFAGSAGHPGSANGTGTTATFNSPQYIAADSSGNVYESNPANYTIRKISSSGVVTTFAGSPGVQGNTNGGTANDGTGTAAHFVYPTAITVDPKGNVYVVDGAPGGQYSPYVRMITPAGVVTTLNGVQFGNFSGGIAVDSGANIYVTSFSSYTSNGVTTSYSSIMESSPEPTEPGVPVYYQSAGSQTNPGFAGGASGLKDGTGSAAEFNNPTALAIDTNGNIYVADSGNNAIRKIAPGWVVTTVAGNGGAGSEDTPNFGGPPSPSESQFNNPVSVAVDSADNLYVADKGNQTIRKITSAGVVTTMAGLTATIGSTDGNGSSALFNGPSGIAVDGNGNIFVADTGNDTIRESAAPTIGFATWVGTAGVSGSNNGTGTAAQFKNPTGIAVDSNGNAYVTDSGNYTIRKITPAGVVSTFAGSPGVQGTADGTGTAASFSDPLAITVDTSNNVYVTDEVVYTNPYPYYTSTSSRLCEISPAGVVTTLYDQPFYDSSDNFAAEPGYSSGIAASIAGNLYYGDAENNIIEQIVPNVPSDGFAGSPSPQAFSFVLAGYAYQGMYGLPGGLTANSDGSGTSATFNDPSGVAVDANDDLYVADQNNDTIRSITITKEGNNFPVGTVTTLAGAADVTGSVDSVGTSAQFDHPFGIAVDTSGTATNGNLYVTDQGNDTIRQISPLGVVSTLAGLATVAGSADGSGGVARFKSPSGIAVDSNGTIYVVDSGNNTIRKSAAQLPPTVVIGPATNISFTGEQSNGTAVLNGTVNANLANTVVEFQYGPDSGFYPFDTSTVTVVAKPGTVTGGSETAVSATITLPEQGNTYYYRIVASNAAGTTTSVVASFQANPTQPSAVLGTLTVLSPSSVTITGTYYPEGTSPLLYFDYGTDPLFASNTTSTGATTTVNSDGSISATLTIQNLSQNTTYYYQLRGVTGSSYENIDNIVTSPSPPGTFTTQLLSGLTQQFPYSSSTAPPPALASLQVILSPSASGSYTPGWRLVGEQLWHASGDTITGLTSGNYEVEYRPSAGYLPPAEEQVSVTSGTTTVNPTVLTRYYYPTPSQGSYNLQIYLYPTNVASAGGWRLYDPTNTTPWNPSGTILSALSPGTYLVECEPIPNQAAPQATPQITPPISSVVVPSTTTVNNVTTNNTTTIGEISYTPTTTPTGTPPPLAPQLVGGGGAAGFATITDTSPQGQTMPYAYVGQIRSDVGLSSGFVVSQYVVATAAHAVYDDGGLTADGKGQLAFATNLQWIFEREAGTYDPVPQTPRGALVLTSYSADRQADGTPGVSSLASQNEDVAALYFTTSAGGTSGGYGGYLASDTTPNEFLHSSTANKILVGYPVDTEPTDEQGEMFATQPVTAAFTELDDQNGNPLQVYTTNALYSFGGNSGGPLCVQAANGNYYPAAIYLGESAQTNVRAINSDAISLFQQAQAFGEGNTNHTGGGTTLVDTTLTGGSLGPVSIQVNLPGAPAGAGWSLGPIGSGYPVFAGGDTFTNGSTGTYNIYYVPVPPYYVTPPTYNTQSDTTLSGVYTYNGIYNGITGQPANVSAITGGSATFSVATTGTPTSYQWQYVSGNNPPVTVTTGTGGTTSTYTITDVTPANQGNYQVLVTWSDGSVTSASATLTVTTPTSYTYAQWLGLYGLPTTTSAAATPQSDGVTDKMKYVFDIDPTRPMTASDIAALPAVSITTYNGQLCLALTFREYKYLDSSTTVNVQTSSTLASGSWTKPAQAVIIPVPGGATMPGDPSPGFAPTNDPLVEALVPLTQPGPQFIRLDIQ